MTVILDLGCRFWAFDQGLVKAALFAAHLYIQAKNKDALWPLQSQTELTHILLYHQFQTKGKAHSFDAAATKTELLAKHYWHVTDEMAADIQNDCSKLCSKTTVFMNHTRTQHSTYTIPTCSCVCCLNGSG